MADVLPNEAHVIRGGYNNRRSVQENARDHHELRGEYALSVFSLADATVEEIAQVAALPNAKIRVTTVGELRAAGFDPVPKAERVMLTSCLPMTRTPPSTAS